MNPTVSLSSTRRFDGSTSGRTVTPGDFMSINRKEMPA